MNFYDRIKQAFGEQKIAWGWVVICLLVVLTWSCAANFYILRIFNQNQESMAAELQAYKTATDQSIVEKQKFQQEKDAQNNTKLQNLKDQLTRVQEQLDQNRSGFQITQSQIQMQGNIVNNFRDNLMKMMSLLSSAESLSDEPKAVTFAYYETSGWKDRVREYVAKNVSFNNGQRSINGGGGTDRINLSANMDILIDGIFSQSIERYDILNSSINNVSVMAPGLADLENQTLEIFGDADLDKVTLDACLKWKKLPDENGMSIWKATDNAKAVRTLKITKGIRAEVGASCNPAYFSLQSKISLKKMIASPFMSAPPQIGTYTTPPVLEVKPPEVAMSYAIKDKENIALYKSWNDHIAVPRIKEDMSWLVGLMEKGKLPTEFLNADIAGTGKKYILKSLSFNPDSTPIYASVGNNTCPNQNGIGVVSNTAAILYSDKPAKINCARGGHFYFTESGHDEISQSYDPGIFSTGAGDDSLKISWGQTLVLLKKGWGHQTIEKTCTVDKPFDAQFYKEISFLPEGGGLGVKNILIKGEGLKIVYTFPNSPAQKAGLKEGDMIVRINDRMVTDMQYTESVLALRGTVGEPVKLSVKSSGSESIRDISVFREQVDFGPARQGSSRNQLISLDWKYPYINFIVFGPGIKRDDIVEQGNNTFVNQKTGDRLELRGNCFNFVYSDD